MPGALRLVARPAEPLYMPGGPHEDDTSSVGAGMCSSMKGDKASIAGPAALLRFLGEHVFAREATLGTRGPGLQRFLRQYVLLQP